MKLVVYLHKSFSIQISWTYCMCIGWCFGLAYQNPPIDILVTVWFVVKESFHLKSPHSHISWISSGTIIFKCSDRSCSLSKWRSAGYLLYFLQMFISRMRFKRTNFSLLDYLKAIQFFKKVMMKSLKPWSSKSHYSSMKCSSTFFM